MSGRLWPFIVGLVLACYVWMRGPVLFETQQTGNNFSWKYDEADETIRFEVKQRRHKVVLLRWLRLSFKTYSYLVEVTRMKHGAVAGQFISSYGQLCSRRFAKTSYPHRCAIAACVRELEYSR